MLPGPLEVCRMMALFTLLGASGHCFTYCCGQGCHKAAAGRKPDMAVSVRSTARPFCNSNMCGSRSITDPSFHCSLRTRTRSIHPPKYPEVPKVQSLAQGHAKRHPEFWSFEL